MNKRQKLNEKSQIDVRKTHIMKNPQMCAVLNILSIVILIFIDTFD